jgi:uncharacterized Fe-S center protein
MQDRHDRTLPMVTMAEADRVTLVNHIANHMANGWGHTGYSLWIGSITSNCRLDQPLVEERRFIFGLTNNNNSFAFEQQFA